MHEEFEFIEFIGRLNGYPECFIKSQIRKTLDRYYDKINGTQSHKSKEKKINNKDNKDNSIKKEHIFFDVPFFGKPTEIFRKKIINLAKSINPQINIQPIQRPPASVSNHFPIKDPLPKLRKSNVVYKLDCTNCEATNIGKTIRQTYRRLQEHGADLVKDKETKSHSTNIIDNSINLRRSERNQGKAIKYFLKTHNESTLSEQNKMTNSAVKQHENVHKHKIDFANFNIIARDNSRYQLLVKESLLIQNLKPTLYKTTCSVPLIIFPEGLRTLKPKVKIKSTSDTLPRIEGSML